MVQASLSSFKANPFLKRHLSNPNNMRIIFFGLALSSKRKKFPAQKKLYIMEIRNSCENEMSEFLHTCRYYVDVRMLSVENRKVLSRSSKFFKDNNIVRTTMIITYILSHFLGISNVDCNCSLYILHIHDSKKML